MNASVILLMGGEECVSFAEFAPLFGLLISDVYIPVRISTTIGYLVRLFVGLVFCAFVSIDYLAITLVHYTSIQVIITRCPSLKWFPIFSDGILTTFWKLFCTGSKPVHR